MERNNHHKNHIINVPQWNRRIPIDESETVLDALKRAELPIGQSCGGSGTCGWCFVQIVGDENLTNSISDREQALLARRVREPNTRIACHTRVQGDITIAVSYWGE